MRISVKSCGRWNLLLKVSVLVKESYCLLSESNQCIIISKKGDA